MLIRPLSYRLLTITLAALPRPARLLFLAAILWSLAWPPLTLHAQYHVDTWTTAAGLPQNSVYSIIQTRDGYIWFTTLDGLVQYDGVQFRVFNRGNSGGGIRSNRFTSLHQSGDGTLWAGTEGDGLTRYRDGKFRTYTVSDGLPHNGVWAMRDEGSAGLFVSTYSGLARLRGERFEALVGDDGASPPRCIDLSTAGACWYQDAAGLHRFLDGQTATYTAEIGLPNKTAFRIFEDREGVTWIAWSSGGVGVIKRDGSFTSYDATTGLPPFAVTAMAQDHSGRLWFGTVGGGLLSFSDNRFVTQLEPSDNAGTDDVRVIYEDREGTLWLGKRMSGLAKLVRQIVTVHTKADGLSGNNVYPVLEDRGGKLWVGVWGYGLSVSTGPGARFARHTDMPFGFATALHEDRNGRLWVGSNRGGLGFLENDKWKEFTPQRATNELSIFVIRESADGSLWWGTGSGLFRYSKGTKTHYTVRDGLPSDDVKDILEDRLGRLWFATFGGLARFEEGHFVSLTEADGLSSNHVRTLYEDADGTLWIGTYDGGLNRYRDGRFTRYTIADGLFNNGVFRIIEDSRGRFWVSSNRGIYRLNKSELEGFAEGRLKSVTSVAYGLQDGLLSTECNGGLQPSGWKTPDGHVLFPTQGGLAVIDPEAVTENPLPPPVVIENCSLDRQPAPLAPEIRVGPGQNNLEINYAGLSFVKPEQVRFRYKLQGLDGDWVEAGSRRTAYYSYLPPGTYEFRVLAANSDGLWNMIGTSVGVVVTPPFYRTRWFYALVGLVAAGLAFGVYETRLLRLRRAHAAQAAFSRQLIESQERERERIAAELHDGLGQNLLVIKNWALLGLRAPAVVGGHEQLDEISAATSQAIDEVREIAYNLRPYQMDEIGLAQALRAMLRKVAASSGIEIVADVDAANGALPKELEINLYRVVQEGINNIIKHSGATRAEVIISRSSRQLLVTIADDGKGFDPNGAATGRTDVSSQRRGFGLTGIGERARMLSGELTVQSELGRGTTLSIRIPLQEHTAAAPQIR
jgi:signal transduction histidine kinase/ligand-binding sensor domain-containing protein